MLGCGDTPVKLASLFCFLKKKFTWFKALCAGGGNVTFLGLIIFGCSLMQPLSTRG